MPPNYEEEKLFQEDEVNKIESNASDRKLQIVWVNIFVFTYLHLAALYGLYLAITSTMWKTCFFAFVLYLMSGLGITAGAHRLWAHRSYKATLPLKIILAIFNLMAFQDSVIQWARDHRMHHKYSETNADPHNATRGFFFSHVGWLLCRKHKEVTDKGLSIDFSDLYNDSVLAFQKKYYMLLMPLLCFVMPTLLPVYWWGETLSNSWFVSTIFRYVFVLNTTWLVNSAAHKYGTKPYNKLINPTENISLAALVLGEGYHNYHHTFPWDYKTAELRGYSSNFTKLFIDSMAKIGWAYDLKTASEDVIKSRVLRTGDGSHNLWGWGDRDQPIFESKFAQRINPKVK